MKQFKILGMLLLVLLAVVTVVSAATSDYRFDKVEVNSILADASTTVFVERGQSLDVNVFLTGTNNTVDNTRVKVWLGGYEYGDVEAESEIFQVEPTISYVKRLTLNVPDDLESSKTYTLHVQAADEVGSLENTYSVRVKEKRHSLVIQDVMFNPNTLSVEAGNNLFATVRVENTGDKKEENVKVVLSVPELGISVRNYIEELVPREVSGSDEESSGNSGELFLKIPDSAKAGTYDVKVDVEFNNGHDVVSQTYTLKVNAKSQTAPTSSLVTFDTVTKEVEQGKGLTFKLSFANLESDSRTYTLELSSVSDWATARVDPATVTVGKDSTADAFVYVSPNDNAAVGAHTVTVKVKEGDNVVKEVALSVNVKEGKSAGETLKSLLKVAFLVLLVVLVVLAVLIGIKRKNDDNGTEDPSTPESQTYYFYPKL